MTEKIEKDKIQIELKLDREGWVYKQLTRILKASTNRHAVDRSRFRWTPAPDEPQSADAKKWVLRPIGVVNFVGNPFLFVIVSKKPVDWSDG